MMKTNLFAEINEWLQKQLLLYNFQYKHIQVICYVVQLISLLFLIDYEYTT
jgi:hypothetical protein